MLWKRFGWLHVYYGNVAILEGGGGDNHNPMKYGRKFYNGTAPHMHLTLLGDYKNLIACQTPLVRNFLGVRL